MKPIDALTGLPKSPDVAKLADANARHGDTQTHSLSVSFSREVSEKARSVSQSQKAERAKIGDEPGRGQTLKDQGRGDQNQTGHEQEEGEKSPHPSKGRIIDIRGA